MINKKYVDLILKCLKNIGKSNVDKKLINSDKYTKLFGPSGCLDSLNLVTLIVDIEQEIFTKYKKNIVLANDQAMSMKTSPFRNVKSLANYIQKFFVTKES